MKHVNLEKWKFNLKYRGLDAQYTAKDKEQSVATTP
jgi:hypothetical protein